MGWFLGPAIPQKQKSEAPGPGDFRDHLTKK